MIRAWRGIDRFEGRAALRSWLYRIATNVCLDAASARERRARPMDLGPAREPVAENLSERGEATWIEPIPGLDYGRGRSGRARGGAGDPTPGVHSCSSAPPARQRAALILCEVLRWKASEAAELLDTSVASINSALQRARATLEQTSRRADAADRRRRSMPLSTSFWSDTWPPSRPTTWTPSPRWSTRTRSNRCRPTNSGSPDGRTSSPGGSARGSAARAHGCHSGPVRQRHGRVWPVQTEPGRRLRAMGGSGTRALRRLDRRAHVLPRYRPAVPAVRATSPVGLSPELNRQPAQLDQLA